MKQDGMIINQGVKLLHVLLRTLAKAFAKYIVECTVQLLWHAKEMNETHRQRMVSIHRTLGYGPSKLPLCHSAKLHTGL